MKKKILVFLMSMFLIISSVACSNNSAEVDKETKVVKEKNEEKKQTNVVEKEEKETANEKDEEKNEKTKSSKDVNVVYISASKLRVREDITTTSEVVGDILKGKKVEILEEKTDEEGNLWYKVEYEPNKTGWIFAKYTVDDLKEILSADLKNIDLDPIEKNLNIEGNERIKVKGVYVTRNSAVGKNLDYLLELVEKTEINTFVIDVKDDYGAMLFETKAAAKYNPIANKKAITKDINALMKKLKEKNVYTIARIVSFKDPLYTNAHLDKAIMKKGTNTPFKSSDGLRWASPHDRDLWNYNIGVAKEAAKAGFNEIQFDYVRFPASNGGKLDASLDYRNPLNESKPETIQKYLKYAREELKDYNVYIGSDVFGLVGSVTDHMGIGQHWEAMSNASDIICPMMYPSHYGSGVYNLKTPDAKPYETVYKSTYDSIKRNENLETPAIIRPWIQDFTASWVKGHIRYGKEEVKAQIKALNDLGIEEYMLWNAANKYSLYK